MKPQYEILFLANIEINQVQFKTWASFGVYTSQKVAYSHLKRIQSFGYKGKVQRGWVTQEEYRALKEQEIQDGI